MIVPESNSQDLVETQTEITSKLKENLQIAREFESDTNDRSIRIPNRIHRNGSEHMGNIASLASYVEILFVHRRLLLSMMCASVILGWFALVAWPRSYMSEAKLMLRVGRETVSLDPTATTSQTLLLQKTQEEEVNAALEILSSRRLAELVVGKIGVS